MKDGLTKGIYAKHHDSLFSPKKKVCYFLGSYMALKGWVPYHDTPLKINMEHNSEGLVQMIFLGKWVIFMFHLNFPGCKKKHSKTNHQNPTIHNFKKRLQCQWRLWSDGGLHDLRQTCMTWSDNGVLWAVDLVVVDQPNLKKKQLMSQIGSFPQEWK